MNILIDFDDSFTFNLRQFFQSSSIELELFNWRDISLIPIDKVRLIVLGPGPGHPLEYPEVISFLSKIINSNVYFFGVCLGHQILMSLLGFKIKRLAEPVHGRAKQLEIPPFLENLFLTNKISAQFYNSLYVSPEGKNEYLSKCIYHEGAILAYFSNNIFSTQFHIESVGTSECSNLLKNLY